jgi:6-phosphofructokinase 1
MYFGDILDPVTKKTRVRLVDPSSESFYIARRYMLRLNQADFEDPHELAKYAATCGISLEEFQKQFYYLMKSDLLYQNLKDGKIVLAVAENNEAHKSNQSVKVKEVKGENGSMMP